MKYKVFSNSKTIFSTVAAIILVFMLTTLTATTTIAHATSLRWFESPVVGNIATGTATLYKNTSDNKLVSLGTSAPTNCNLLKSIEIREKANVGYIAYITFYRADRATNYQNNSSGIYRGYNVNGCQILIVQGDDVKSNRNNIELSKTSETFVELSLAGASSILQNIGNTYNIEIAYKFRNNIFAYKGNYIVCKSANILAFESPSIFSKVKSLTDMTAIGAITSASSFLLINEQTIPYAQSDVPITAYVKRNGGALIPLFDGTLSNSRGYKTLSLAMGINNFVFYDIYGTAYSLGASNPNFTITRT